MILSCFRCRDNTGRGAKYQDRMYGKGMRVHNAMAKSGNTRSYRCTVCGNERSAGDQR
jgi:hypothetical protein